MYVAKTTIPVAKDVYIRPTSISFLRICQNSATDVVVVACLRGVFSVSLLIAACQSIGSCSLRKQFIYASRGFCPNGGTQRCVCFQLLHKLVQAVRLMAFVTTVIEAREKWFCLLDGEGDGNEGGVWLGEETSDAWVAWWKKMTTRVAWWKKMTTLLTELLRTTTSMFQLRGDARLRRGTVGTNIRESSRVKYCESVVRRTSKRERCNKELVNNNHTLQRPSKVKRKSLHSPPLLLVFSRWACKNFDNRAAVGTQEHKHSYGAGCFRSQTARKS